MNSYHQVLRFRRGGAHKTVQDDEEEGSINESPKISFRWEVESCTTTSSAFSVASTSKNGQSIPPSISTRHEEADEPIVYRRNGNWITTDSECKLTNIFPFYKDSTLTIYWNYFSIFQKNKKYPSSSQLTIFVNIVKGIVYHFIDFDF